MQSPRTTKFGLEEVPNAVEHGAMFSAYNTYNS
jgi:hypothetical protein